MSDQKSLIERAKQSDADAFTQIYEDSYSRILSYIYYRVSDRETAEDLAADVFVRMVRKIDTYEDTGRPIIAWLYTIAGNLVLDYHRRDSKYQWLPIEDREIVSTHDPTALADLNLTSERLAKAIQELTDEQSNVIVLKFVQGLSNAEIADIMGKQEGSIKSLQHRALQSLKRILEKEDGVGSNDL